jgi:hypothetical protein|nr:MAG TPA: hypothetical protein [Caudoviricetes sp.]
MKAKEYYDKYQSIIVVGLKGKKVDKIQELVAELYNETIQLIANSKSHADSAVVGICKQQCQKFDRIAELFERDYGRRILKKGGFNTTLMKRIPELEGRL